MMKGYMKYLTTGQVDEFDKKKNLLLEDKGVVGRTARAISAAPKQLYSLSGVEEGSVAMPAMALSVPMFGAVGSTVSKTAKIASNVNKVVKAHSYSKRAEAATKAAGQAMEISEKGVGAVPISKMPNSLLTDTVLAGERGDLQTTMFEYASKKTEAAKKYIAKAEKTGKAKSESTTKIRKSIEEVESKIPEKYTVGKTEATRTGSAASTTKIGRASEEAAGVVLKFGDSIENVSLTIDKLQKALDDLVLKIKG